MSFCTEFRHLVTNRPVCKGKEENWDAYSQKMMHTVVCFYGLLLLFLCTIVPNKESRE